MKKNIGAYPFVYPTPVALVGVHDGKKSNFTEVGDCGIMGISPPLVYISLHENHFSTSVIQDQGRFSINFPDTSMVERVDFCGIYSGNEKDKSELFDVEMHQDEIPMIKECPVTLICSVEKHVVIETRNIFISRVESTFIEEDLFDEKDHPRFSPLGHFKPILYGLDNRYYAIGKVIGEGYKEGRDIEK